MSLTPQLQIRQSQQLAMTPQLQQSLKMLQMNTADLWQAVMQEVEQNPLLELEGATEMEQREPAAETKDETENEAEALPEQGDSAVDSWNTSQDGASDYGKPRPESEGDFLSQIADKPASLRQHLEQQILLDFEDPAERLIALQLLDHLEPSGYISADYLAVCHQLGCTEEAVNQALEKLQHLDPPGIFARNLSECLRLQLRERDRLDPAMEAMLANLELIAQADFKKLARLCGVSEEDIRDMCQELRSLNPKPAQHFEHATTENWQPDVIVRRLPGQKEYRVELNMETMPKVLFHREYYADVSGKTKDKAERKTLTEYAQSANWLVRSLEQRANSILKVASEVVLMQQEFFDKGIYYLKPMTLKAVAERVDLHESTVGRVVNGKYMSTPKGTFEFRYFFSSAVGAGEATNGEDLSSHAIKELIRECIEAESPTAILSDDAIAGKLKEKGLEVARRTVAKYREAIGIPGSAERRRSKRISG